MPCPLSRPCSILSIATPSPALSIDDYFWRFLLPETTSEQARAGSASRYLRRNYGICTHTLSLSFLSSVRYPSLPEVRNLLRISNLMFHIASLQWTGILLAKPHLDCSPPSIGANNSQHVCSRLGC